MTIDNLYDDKNTLVSASDNQLLQQQARITTRIVCKRLNKAGGIYMYIYMYIRKLMQKLNRYARLTWAMAL